MLGALALPGRSDRKRYGPLLECLSGEILVVESTAPTLYYLTLFVIDKLQGVATQRR